MSDGEILKTLQGLLQGEQDLSAVKVTLPLVLACQIETLKAVGDLRSDVSSMDKRLGEVEAAQKISQSETVKWPFLREKFGVPVVIAVVATFISLAAAWFTGLLKLVVP